MRRLPNTRGIRQILNVHEKKLFDYMGRHIMREPRWRENFALLRRHDLSFDLQLYPSQMEEAAALARAHADTQFIVNHAGMFVDRTAWPDIARGATACARWPACPNVAVKISGLAMFDQQWTVESLRPYVLETIDTFGVERAMFASNFPVDRLFGTYEALVERVCVDCRRTRARARKTRCFAATRSASIESDRI